MASQSHSNPDHVRQPKPAIDDASYDDEPTKEDILEGIRIGMRQALAGETTPVKQLFDEVRRELEDNADTG